MARRSKSVEDSTMSPLNVVASKSKSFETVVTVETNWFVSSEEKSIRFQPLRLCRLEYQPLCSFPRQHDQHVIQLSGNVANKSSFKSQSCERQVIDGCWSSSFSPLVILTLERTSTKNAPNFCFVAVALLRLSPFLSLQLAIVQVPAVLPELVAQLPLFGLRSFVLSRSTLSCQQGSAAFPSFFNSFSTFRADHGMSLSFALPVHNAPIPPLRLRYH